MERLTAEDQLMLWPDEIWPQDIGALVVLDGTNLFDPGGRFRIEAVRDAVAGRLHLVARFRQRLYAPSRRLGGPLWVDAPGFDLAHHMSAFSVPAPGDEAQLLLTVEQLRRQRFDRSRPLWEMWFLTGLRDNRVGLLVRMHHAIADGLAGLATIATFLDATVDLMPPPPRPWTPAPMPTERELRDDKRRRQQQQRRETLFRVAHPMVTARRVRAAWSAMRELLARKPGPRTSLDRVVGPDRRFALIRSSLEPVKEVAHAHGATVNDVLLTAAAGGLRGLLGGRGEPVEDVTLRIYVPVSLHQGPRAQARGNLIAQMAVPLPIGVSDPVQRLRLIATETTRRKARSRPSLGMVPRRGIASRVFVKLINRQRINVTSANIPGPEMPLYFAGAPVLEVFPVLPLIANVSIGVGALSYAGQFNITVVADRDAYPDIDLFTKSAHDELEALAASTQMTYAASS